MTRSIRGIANAIASVLFALAGSGCAILLPAHSHSNRRDGERVQLTLLDRADVEADAALVQAYEAAFEVDWNDRSRESVYVALAKPAEPGARLAAAGPLIGIAVGVAVDASVAEMRREATLYEAQFGALRAVDEFWLTRDDAVRRAAARLGYRRGAPTAGDLCDAGRRAALTPEPVAGLDAHTTHALEGEMAYACGRRASARLDPRTASGTHRELVQHYYGFRLERFVDGETSPAFSLVAGLAPSRDQQMFRVAPLRFETRRAKAKVLSNQWWSYLPGPIVGKLFRTQGQQIDSKVAVQIEGYWRGKDQQLAVAKLASIEWKFPAYDIGKGEPLVTANPTQSSGWMVAVPVSFADGQDPVGLGTFALSVDVTERDKSNAPQLLEQAAKFLSEQKPKLVKAAGGSGQ